jgi:transposase
MTEDARKVGKVAQQEKRKTAFRMREQGHTFKSIGDAVGVHPRTVVRWFAMARTSGKKLVIKGGQAGRVYGAKRRLSSDQESEIRRLIIDKMPDQMKMPFALWTRAAIRELIYERFGIDMPIRTVGDYLLRWGFTPQRPLKKAYRQNPAAVMRWKETEYPEIRRRAKRENAEIQWSDETGIRSDQYVGSSYSPKGLTPVREVSGSRFSTNMISSITNQGKVKFMTYEEKMTSKVFIEFLRRLVKDNKGRKIFLILDNLPVHHSKAVKEWVSKRISLIELFYLPSYAPELNVVEYMNGDMKRRIKSGRAAKT